MRNPSSSSSSSGASNSKTTTTTTPCCSKVGLKRGPWTAEEDQLLSDYIKREGEGRWRTLPKRAGLLRCGKSCRLRWMNYLRPNVKRGHISSDEEDLILRLHRLLGNRWSLIAGRIPGRTDNEIKNYWNTHLSKKLISQGIDPRTHKPLHPTTATDSDSNINNNKSTAVMTSKTTNTIINTNTDDVTQAAPTNPNSSIPSTTTTATVPLASSDMIDNNHADVLPANSTVLEDQINQHQRKDDDNEDDLNTYCTDEVFSSFLNSLINDDMFTQPGQSTDAPVLGYGNDAAAAPSWDPLSAYHHHDSHHDAIIN